MAKFFWLKVPLIVAITFLFLASSLIAQTFRYDRIEVSGNQRIDIESVIEITGLPASGSVSASAINQAFRALSDQGIFEEIAIVPQQGVLEITVREYPTINQVVFEGNRRIKDGELSEIVSAKPRQVYLPSRARDDAATIALVYYSRGRFATEVNPVIIRRSDNRVDLVFEIAEGRVVEVERLSFIGNSAFTDRRLRRVLSTKQASSLRTFVQRDTYFAERLELDKSLLRDFYLANGFIDFEIESVSTELARERDAFLITFKISEGPKYSYGEITASSDLVDVDPELFLEKSRLKTGRTYSPVTLTDSVERLQYYASEQGFDFIRVRPITSVNSDNAIDVNFLIERGERIIVERIEIEGNATTLDRVIRREFRIVEGDPLNPTEIARATERIRALNLFNDVSIRERVISPTQRAYTLTVDEALTGSLSFGVGYSQEANVSGNVSVTERNFLGRGQAIGISLEVGADNRNTNLSFFEPRLFDQNISYEGVLGWRKDESDENAVNIDEFTFFNSIGFPLDEFSRLTLNAGVSRLQPEIYTGTSSILENDLGENAQRITRRISLGYSYSFNRIGTGYNRNSGFAGRFGQTVFLGNHSHNSLRTTGLVTTRISPLGSDVVFSGTLEGGVVRSNGKTTRLSDRFQTNSRILRGFTTSGIGPRSIDGKALGGNQYLALRLESQFPLGFADDAGITGGVFFDAGSVWGLDNTVELPFPRKPKPFKSTDDRPMLQGPPLPSCGALAVKTTKNMEITRKMDEQNVTKEEDIITGCSVDDSFKIRSSIGFSIFVETGLGPLRLNFSRPVKKYPGDKKQNFELTLSSTF